MSKFHSRIIFFTLILCSSVETIFSNHSKEFLYPVAATVQNESIKIYLVYQKSVGHLELLVWDPVTKITTKGLLSTFTPGIFKILPDGSGFSFIDNDRILVRSFTKRSPKSVAFYVPIDDIGIIEWIDNSLFYFMAKEAHRYSLFQANTQGDLHVLLADAGADYMYPQKVGESLFFIKRTKNNDVHHYQLMRAPYPTIISHSLANESALEQMEFLKKEQREQMRSLIPLEDISPLVDLGERPAAFLHMVSSTQGFYLEHPRSIEKGQECLSFTYWQLDKTSYGWETKKLFSFSLPAHFFLEKDPFRLYESLLPFLPRHSAGAIYFMDCYDNRRLKVGIVQFDTTTMALKRISADLLNSDMVGDAFFAPLCVNSMVFYGGTLLPEDLGTGNRFPAVWINEDGLICADLPVVLVA